MWTYHVPMLVRNSFESRRGNAHYPLDVECPCVKQEFFIEFGRVLISAPGDNKRKVVRQNHERRHNGQYGVSRTMIVTWYATFEDEQGESQEYELFALNFLHGVREPEPELAFYDKLTAGDAGVLYARDAVAFDFDKVC